MGGCVLEWGRLRVWPERPWTGLNETETETGGRTADAPCPLRNMITLEVFHRRKSLFVLHGLTQGTTMYAPS